MLVFLKVWMLLSYAFRKSPYLLRICTEVLTNGMISWICLKIIQGWIREGRGVLIDKTVICHFLIIVRAMWWVFGSSLYFSLYFCIYFKFTVRKKSSGCALATQFFPWKDNQILVSYDFLYILYKMPMLGKNT